MALHTAIVPSVVAAASEGLKHTRRREQTCPKLFRHGAATAQTGSWMESSSCVRKRQMMNAVPPGYFPTQIGETPHRPRAPGYRTRPRRASREAARRKHVVSALTLSASSPSVGAPPDECSVGGPNFELVPTRTGGVTTS